MQFFRRAPKVTQTQAEPAALQVFVPVRPAWIELSEEQRAALSLAIQRADDQIPCEGGIEAVDEAERSGDRVVIPFANYASPAKPSPPEPELRIPLAANGEQDFPII